METLIDVSLYGSYFSKGGIDLETLFKMKISVYDIFMKRFMEFVDKVKDAGSL